MDLRRLILTNLNETELTRNDVSYAFQQIGQFFKPYEESGDPGYLLKIVHTYHVAENCAKLAQMTGCSEEDILLSSIIGLLHDIGRFAEMKETGEFNGSRYDHASKGVEMLFEEGMIRRFLEKDQYDQIIRTAIACHSLVALPEIEDDKTLLHAKLIRDADKLDNFRVKIDEPVENLFPGCIASKQLLETSYISDAVYDSLRKKECVKLKDRVTPLDYLVTIIGFYFDLNFKASRQIIHKENLIRRMIKRFDFIDEETNARINEIVSLTE